MPDTRAIHPAEKVPFQAPKDGENDRYAKILSRAFYIAHTCPQVRGSSRHQESHCRITSYVVFACILSCCGAFIMGKPLS